MEKCVLPALLYDGKTCSLAEIHKDNLMKTQRTMKRSMLKIKRFDKLRNSKIREKTKMKKVTRWTV